MTIAHKLNKKFLIIGLITVLVLAGTGLTYLYSENLRLKEKIAESRQETDEKIGNLENKLKALNKVEAPKPKLNLNDEDELLASLFPEIAALQESSEENENNEDVTQYLVVDPEVYDFGQISKKDGLAKASYTLKNQGDKDITISYAFTSCGCTAAPLEDDVILQPGDSYPLEVTFDPNFYGPQYELGDITKNVTIMSNDPRKPFYKVSLKAHVVP